MYYFIGIICFVQVVNADVYLGEGYRNADDCEAGGIQATCNWASKCPSYEIQERYIPRACWPRECPPLPETTFCGHLSKNLVCCTDCYIDTARKAVVTLNGIIWRQGLRKSYEKCAEYAASLPYPIKDDKKVTIIKVYDKEKKCHNIDVVWKDDKVIIRQEEKQLRRDKVDFPYIALLGNRYENIDSQFFWYCQASVISNRFLITSAYCAWVYSDILSYVVLGIDKFPESNPTLFLTKWQRIEVKEFFRHPDYKHPALYFNIGLIKTVNEIQLGVNVLPICLNDQPMIPENVFVDVFRREGFSNNTKVNIQKIDEKECSAKIDAMPLDEKNKYFPRGIDFDIHMCYEDFDEELEPCDLRSKRIGRPIFSRGAFEGMKYAVGISSKGECTQDTNTTIHISTRIDKVLPWIESIVWPEY